MVCRRRIFLLIAFAVVASRWAIAAEQLATGNDHQGGHKFLRLTRDEQGNPVSMDTAIASYVPADGRHEGLQVDLIGAVHIGERDYYEKLNKAFANYQVVLYELVAPKGTRIPKGGARSVHPVSMLQSGMKEMLGLESQVERIDYSRDNLVHADMSPEDFSKSMEDRGDNFFALFFRLLGRSLAEQSKQQALAQTGRRPARSNDAELLLALFDPRRSFKLKQVMAEQFEDLEGIMDVFEGPNGSTLISERNKVALQGLGEQIEAGKRRIAIFYGAGHMPDMEQRLCKEFRMKRSGEQWLVAWHLTPRESRKSIEEKKD